MKIAFRKLETLRVANCINITDLGIQDLSLSDFLTKSLTNIDFSFCKELSDESIVPLGQQCLNLKVVNLQGVYRITTMSSRTLTHNCHQLEHLKLSDCIYITDDTFIFDRFGDGREIVRENMCRKLQTLDISFCERITPKGLEALSLKPFQSMRKMMMKGCHKITDELFQNWWTLRSEEVGKFEERQRKIIADFGELDEGFTEMKLPSHFFPFHLRVLDLSYCTQVSDRGFENLAKTCTQLEELRVDGCIQLTDEGVYHLANASRHIQKLSVSR